MSSGRETLKSDCDIRIITAYMRAKKREIWHLIKQAQMSSLISYQSKVQSSGGQTFDSRAAHQEGE